MARMTNAHRSVVVAHSHVCQVISDDNGDPIPVTIEGHINAARSALSHAMQLIRQANDADDE